MQKINFLKTSEIFSIKNLLLIFAMLVASSNFVFSQDLFGVTNHLWKPQKDDVFLQEVSEKIPTENPVTSIVQYENNCYAVISKEVYLLEGSSLVKDGSAPSGITELVNVEGSLGFDYQRYLQTKQ